MSAQSLLTEIKKHLPLRAYGNGPVLELMRAMGLQANKKTPLVLSGVYRDSESGEIVCEVSVEGSEKFSAALANLKLDITHPLYRQVKNYRDEVANALAEQDNPNVNSQSFSMRNLYGKK
ncbi:hypothetical protein ACTRW9_13185 [Nitrospina sp. 32_T5]|uniref:hypothetical protein n=1 Tax=unclassified Nitrospina TaxID=2638683 RepID=UPI003F9E19D4